MKKLSILFFFTLISQAIMAQISYQVSFPRWNNHYASITIELIKDPKIKELRFSMPTWTPGSYKIREFSRNIDKVYAESGDKSLFVSKEDKNTWVVACEDFKEVSFTYNVFCFEQSVRESYVDGEYAFLHGPSAFMLVEGFEHNEIDLQIKPLRHWSSAHIAAKELGPYNFSLPNYDDLADAPLAIGNFDTVQYQSAGLTHCVVMLGKGNYKLAQIRRDFKTISDEQYKLFNDQPAGPIYIHFVYNVDNGGGGLEHKNSQTSMVNRFAYANRNKYLGFLRLIAHEYFHLWNVKRLRPIELGPFDYHNENYTELLWFAEGFTSFYDKLTIHRAGFTSRSDYLRQVAGQISSYENTPGKNVMSLAHSSKNAWVKLYNPNRDSKNTNISYYNKGMLLALLLNAHILKATNGEKSLDNLMYELYWDTYKKDGAGFTFQTFVNTVNKLTGIDLTKAIDQWVYGKGSLDYTILEEIGLKISIQERQGVPFGMQTQYSGGITKIVSIAYGSSAMKAGLSANDELIAINGYRINQSLPDFIKTMKPRENLLELSFQRDGRMMSVLLTNQSAKEFRYMLSVKKEISDFQEKALRKWMP
ncbi:MAG: Uncharacterised protein [Bacteroidetes bacterium MED-G17]|nr:MAG: Uncharacterised protein [Bacteroidetes bacterium MED-G17]|tara:strand:+ start:13220 stop:14986 length:1767 start_codon:yes stop_codon:yes gene_type:complete